jgi:hypothetical protein
MLGMKAFIWQDAYHVDYGRGDIVVVAEKLEDALPLAIAEMERLMRGRPAAWLAGCRRSLERDPPEIVSPGCAAALEWSE